MATNNMKSDFSLPKDGYLAFDSLSLKQFLKDRLTQNGVFTDQAYEGSNIAQIIDILAYTFNTLIYYLNRTSPESMFTDAQIYENINRIVKAIGYNPIGAQTSLLTFTCSADSNINNGLYTLPRYSYLNLGTISYSFNEDITFLKSLTGTEILDVMSNKLLYQGRYVEYPVYTATGEESELIYLLPGDNVKIDHFNIDIYVKDANTEAWKQWERTTSLYLETSTDEKYEIRLNDDKHYEIKFGNNINGKKLNEGDLVCIYYLKSDASDGEVGANALQAGRLIRYNTTQFNEVFNGIQTEAMTLLSDDKYTNLYFDNQSSSTYSAAEEDVESIRNNASGNFRSQYRLVTESDFENFVKTNFSNLIHDVKVANNWSYLSTYLKYFYDIGITDPNNSGRVLFNQVNFADSCNFNNVYLYIVPKVISNTKNPISYLNPSLKSLIMNSMNDVKLLTCEPVIIDPIFSSFDIGISKDGVTVDLTDKDNTELLIVKNSSSKRDVTSIQTDIYNIFNDYFTRVNCNLGQIIDINYLNNQILSVDGVSTFYTRRKDNTNISYNGLSLLMWNPIYLTDIKFLTQNTALNNFQFPFLNDVENFTNKINVQTTITTFEGIEY